MQNITQLHMETASDAIEDEVLQSKHHNTRQRKVYKMERASRRLGCELAQFGMFAEQSVTPPLHGPSLRTSNEMRTS
jgi:hypothetical protein